MVMRDMMHALQHEAASLTVVEPHLYMGLKGQQYLCRCLLHFAKKGSVLKQVRGACLQPRRPTVPPCLERPALLQQRQRPPSQRLPLRSWLDQARRTAPRTRKTARCWRPAAALPRS